MDAITDRSDQNNGSASYKGRLAELFNRTHTHTHAFILHAVGRVRRAPPAMGSDPVGQPPRSAPSVSAARSAGSLETIAAVAVCLVLAPVNPASGLAKTGAG